MINKLGLKKMCNYYKIRFLEKIYITTRYGLLVRKIDKYFKFKNRKFIVLGSNWPGLGDNLQFSTLPEEFWNQYKRYTYISNQAKFRNNEIYDLVWGCNPYVKGTINRKRNIGDLPFSTLKNISNSTSSVPNWEALNGLIPTNSLPKIYYKPKSKSGFKNVVLVDLSSTSMQIADDSEDSIDFNDPTIYKLSSLKKACKDVYRKLDKLEFVEVKFPNINVESKPKARFSDLVGIDNKELTINSIFDYCDYIHSSHGIITLYSGQSALSSAIKNSGSEVKIYCIITKSAKLNHEKNSGFLFENINFVEC